MSERVGTASRGTAETEIEVRIDVDGDGESEVDTGIGFFDHMLASFATHGRFDLQLVADGDLHIDDHHTVEDAGIVLGDALADALGEKAGVERFADRRCPLDEAVGDVVLDLSGRPYFEFSGTFSQDRVGELTSDMARHFFRSVAMNAGFTLHCDVEGENAHHEIEALFKSFARALDDATRERGGGVPSTKGEL
mgnify:CR=1 FL=1